MRPARTLRCVVSIVAIAAAIDAAAHTGSPRLIVKYRAIDSCPACSAGRSASIPGAAEAALAELEARIAARSTRPLFAPRHRPGRSRTFGDRLAEVRRRFPARAARAAADAVLPDLDGIHVLELPPGADPDRLADELAQNPLIEWAHADREMRVDLIPDDALFSQQWGAMRIDAPIVWNTAAGAGAVIAIVDTGVDAAHPDVATNLWSNTGEIPGNATDDDGNGFVDDLVGWDFVGGDAVPEDRHGHGTHVAGIAAASGDNGIGIAGIGYAARVMALKGLADDGFGWESTLASAILYAAENGADVINNSWTGPGPTPLMADTIAAARALGAIVVAAAGNQGSSANNRQPAGVPGVIAVAASTESDGIASFSNFGDVVSVAAPGVNVLSLRAAGAIGLGSNGIVAPGYQMLSGTSMAAPHVAGLAAVVLSAMPGLQADEVRWQLELNARQPGAPGYESEPWNPYFGWGRIDAGRVFEPIPVTTRLDRPANLLHAIAGTITPGVARLGLAFTSLDPVPWSLIAPPWLPGSPASGDGAAEVSFDLDATGLAPGTVVGAIELLAPGAVDGGGSAPVVAHVHRDERIGAASLLASDTPWLHSRPVIATDGVGSLVVWDEGNGPSLLLAHVDGSGSISPTTTLVASWPPQWQPAIAFDGRNYLIVWFEVLPLPTGWLSSIKGARVMADGTPLDATPFTIAERKSGFDDVYRDPRVAFDGQAYTVIWEDWRGKRGETRVQSRRVGADGVLRGRRAIQLYPDKSGRDGQHVEPAIGCAAGRCLVAWAEFDGETAPPDSHYVDKGYGILLEGGVPLAKVGTRLVDDIQVVLGVASDGTDFLLTGFTRAWCATAGKLQDIAVASRVTAAGLPLDLDPIRLDRTTPDCPQTIAHDAAFDGDDYVIPFRVLAEKPAGLEYGYYLFGARLARDGTLLDDEVEGLLLHDEPRVSYSAVAATRLATVVAWNERGADRLDRVRLRRVLPRASTPGYPSATIGAIGTLVVAEGQDLLRTILPPAGFDPGTTTLVATGLPPGAVFDAPTGALRWRPDGAEAGVHPGVAFTATSGAQVASETIAIAVGEAIRSLGGRVRLANGSPVTDVGVQIGGVAGEKPIAFTDRDGRYRLTGLAPRVYSAKLDSASRQRYRVLGKTQRIAVGAGDAVVPDMVVEPK